MRGTVSITSYPPKPHHVADFVGQLSLDAWTRPSTRSLVLMEGEAEQRRRFAFALQKALTAQDVSVRALADAMKIDPRKVTGWLRGRGLPNLFESQALAAALNVDESLFRYPPEVPPAPPEPYYPLEKYLLGAVGEGVRRGRRRPLPTPVARDAPARRPAQRRKSGGRG